MAQTIFPLDAPVEVVATGMPNAGDYDVWKTLNLRTLADIPTTATGVIFHIENYNTGADRKIAFRKTGSTDEEIKTMGYVLHRDSHCWGMIGVNGSGQVDVYIQYQGSIYIYIVGYTIAGVTFKTNAVELTDSAEGGNPLNEWFTKDLTAYAPNAIGVILEGVSAGSGADRAAGVRMYGSTDDRTGMIWNHTWAIIGCDSSQRVQLYKGGNNTRWFLVGYITDGCVFQTNQTELFTGPQVWADKTIAANRIFAFIECMATGGVAYKWGLRKNGSSEDITRDVALHCWGWIECDGESVIEGYAERDEVDVYGPVGYAIKQTISPSPANALVRVSSIRHIFRPSMFRMQVALGDLGFDVDVAEATVKGELDIAREPSRPDPRPITPSDIPEYPYPDRPDVSWREAEREERSAIAAARALHPAAPEAPEVAPPPLKPVKPVFGGGLIGGLGLTTVASTEAFEEVRRRAFVREAERRAAQERERLARRGQIVEHLGTITPGI